jgi:hypothetical protein
VLAHASHQGQGEGAVEQCCWGVFLWYRPGLCQYRSKPAAYLLPVSPGVEAKDDRTTHQTQAMPPYLLRHQRPAALSRLSLPVSPSLCLPSCLARTVSLTVSRTASLPVSPSPSLPLCRSHRLSHCVATPDQRRCSPSHARLARPPPCSTPTASPRPPPTPRSSPPPAPSPPSPPSPPLQSNPPRPANPRCPQPQCVLRPNPTLT